MFNMKKTMWLLAVTALLALTACGGGAAASPTVDPGAVYTAAVQTAYYQLTQTALVVTNTPAQPTATLTPAITNTPLLTNTPLSGQATNTPFSLTQIGPTQTNCNKLAFISDVTVPDGTDVAPGDVFNKIWKIQNTGDCTWDDGFGLVPGWGDIMGGPYYQALTTVVKPGEFVEISIVLTAPVATGEYFGAWRMQDDRGYNFGTALTVVIKVTGTPTP